MRATGNKSRATNDILSIRFTPDGLSFTSPRAEGGFRFPASCNAATERAEAVVSYLASHLPPEVADRAEVFFDTFRMTAFPVEMLADSEADKPATGRTDLLRQTRCQVEDGLLRAILSDAGFTLEPGETVVLTAPSPTVCVAVVTLQAAVKYLIGLYGSEGVSLRTPFDRTLPLHAASTTPLTTAWLADRRAYVSHSSKGGTLRALEVYAFRSEADLVYMLSTVAAPDRKVRILLCGPDSSDWYKPLKGYFRLLRCV